MRQVLRNTLCLLITGLVSIPTLADEKLSLENDLKLTRSMNEFAIHLHEAFTLDHETNFVFSPYLLYRNLSLLSQGARDVTSTQISKTLKLPIYDKALNQTQTQLHAKFFPSSNTSFDTLKSSEALWLDMDSFILSKFRHLAASQYETQTSNLTFSSPSQAAVILNTWVSNQTQNKLSHMVEDSQITPSSRMISTGFILLEGYWAIPFEERKTSEKTFKTYQQEAVLVQVMENLHLFPYFENDLVQVLSLPIKKNNDLSPSLAMLIALPKSSVQELLSSMNEFSFSQWLYSLDDRFVHVELPKFTIQYLAEFSSSLSKLGIKNAFTPKADFSGINGMKDLYLNKILQSHLLVFDEQGVHSKVAPPIKAPQITPAAVEVPLQFSALKPFCFFLVELSTRTILIQGNFTQPEAGGVE
ncbi:MAG: serpin family protein [Chlamydiae bacterium]|nr:serpin family protein [Chlamydiota bacterium]